MSQAQPTILFVDDEPAVLEGYRRLLHRDFEIETAVGGPAALRLMAGRSFAVVVSDMRMPEMNGVEFFGRVKTIAPDTVRMMLTGYAEVKTAIDAVNEGSIFRFLTKPSSKDVLARALTAGLMQYRLVIAERELLEKTLSGTIKVLTEVLSLVNPSAFSRAMRIRRYVQHITTQLGLGSPWRFEVAAMMSQLGCVTLEPELLESVYAGRDLSPEEQARFDAHPTVARNLLCNIPRMEPIAWMIAQQQHPAASLDGLDGAENVEPIRVGAQMLRVALAFDRLIATGKSKEVAIRELGFGKEYDPKILKALAEVTPECEQMESRNCQILELTAGMVLAEEIRTSTGMLVVARGQEITYALVERLRNFWHREAIAGTVLVLVPRPTVPEAISVR